jgi:hypothetical protein
MQMSLPFTIPNVRHRRAPKLQLASVDKTKV